MRAGLRGLTRHASWVLLLIVVWLAFTAWMRPLTVPDEGRYVGVAWQMMHSGDWLTPTIDGLPFFHKPPLFYWITGGAMTVFGLHEWPARLASIIGASAAAFGLFLFARRWAGRTVAQMSLGVLLTMPLFFMGGQFANLDMLVAGCISVATLLLAHAALSDTETGRRDRTALAAAYAALALGVLAKGLIGLVLPGLVLVVWLGWLRRVRILLRLFWWPGVALFAAITLPWFVLMQDRFADFFNYFFIVQQFRRFTEGGFNNQQPFWFYPAAMALLSLPWTPWLLAAFGPRVPERAAPQPVRLLMLVWLLAIVGFFSLPQSKLIGYILPAMAPLAFLIADAAHARAHRAPASAMARWWSWSLVLAGLLCVGAVVVLARLPLSSAHTLGKTLLAQRQPGEPLLFLGDNYYDISFYAHVTDPIAVVQEWSDPAIHRRDNWVKEFADAGQFATPQTVARVLVTPARLPAILCAQPVSWVMAPVYSADPKIYPFLAHAARVATEGRNSLWRIDRSAPALADALHCAPPVAAPAKPAHGG